MELKDIVAVSGAFQLFRVRLLQMQQQPSTASPQPHKHSVSTAVSRQ